MRAAALELEGGVVEDLEGPRSGGRKARTMPRPCLRRLRRHGRAYDERVAGGRRHRGGASVASPAALEGGLPAHRKPTHEVGRAQAHCRGTQPYDFLPRAPVISVRLRLE